MEIQVCKCCGRELPVENFTRNVFGVTHVCKECNSKNRSDAARHRKEKRQQAIDALNARNLRLSDFTPRELMAELKRRGYDGKITYTRIETIDLSTI